MKTIVRHDDLRIAGRNQQRLTDRAWWGAVAKQPKEQISVVRRADDAFDYVEIEIPDEAALETLNHVLSRLDSSLD